MTKPRILTEAELAIAREMRAQGIGIHPICQRLRCGARLLTRSLCAIEIGRPPTAKKKPVQSSRDPWTDVPIGSIPKGHPLYEADQEMLRAQRTRPTAVGDPRASSMAWD